jgi:adenylylsulfate kinase-like enzyme
MELTSEEEDIRQEAIEFARKNKKKIAKRLTDRDKYPPEDNPVSVFMAGSPGAGKTEASKALIDSLSDNGTEVLRIDPDDLRSEFESYTGDNSHLYQGGTSILVSKILDLAFSQSQSFLLDGTLSSYQVAKDNIDRSLKKDRYTQILYVYQRPELAWEFVLAREAQEGRRILPESFIEQYFESREVVNRLKRKFGRDIQVDLLLKDRDGSNRVYKDNIDNIDNFAPERYTLAALADLITL